MVSHLETGSDPLIGSDRESGRDIMYLANCTCPNIVFLSIY